MKRRSLFLSLASCLALPACFVDKTTQAKTRRRTLTMPDGVILREGELLLPKLGNHPYRLVRENRKWKIISLCDRRVNEPFWEKPETMYNFVNLRPVDQWLEEGQSWLPEADIQKVLAHRA